MNKEDDVKIVGKTDVGGRTGWDKDRMQKKRESDNERGQELIGGWMDRQDDKRAAMTRKEGRFSKSRGNYENCERLCMQNWSR